MKPADRKSCICGCGATFARTKTLPLCRDASQRVHQVFRAAVQANPPENYQRAYSAFYGSPETVAAALAGA